MKSHLLGYAHINNARGWCLKLFHDDGVAFYISEARYTVGIDQRRMGGCFQVNPVRQQLFRVTLIKKGYLKKDSPHRFRNVSGRHLINHKTNLYEYADHLKYPNIKKQFYLHWFSRR